MRALRLFPYRPRRYQDEVIEVIFKSIRTRNVCLHAPTGFGKTPVILAALLPYIDDGYRIIWSVRTGNETDRPIEELKVFAEKKRLKVFGFSIRGKRDMCLLAREYGENFDYSDVSYLCSRMRKKCPYYNKLRRGIDPYPIVDMGPLVYSEVFRVASSLGVCPYFLQFYLLEYADVVSLSYNYVVDERFEWSIRRIISFPLSILVVDEAHNLQRLELGSDTITLGTLARALKELEDYKADDVKELVERVQDLCIKIRDKLKKEEDTEFNPLDFISQEDIFTLKKAQQIGEDIRRKRLNEGKQPRSSLYHFSNFWLSALDLLDVKGIAFIAERENENLSLNIWDMRSSEVLSKRWPLFYRCVFCSGTLKPIKAFAEIIGLSNYVSIGVPNIFRRENIRSYIIRDLTTRGEILEENMARDYVKTIILFLNKIRVNTAIFTASYRIQNSLKERGLIDNIRSIGFEVFEERRNLRGQEARRILDTFKKKAVRKPSVLIAPMGGRFAEGADFPGKLLEAIFLVGIPFEKPSVKVKLYLEYYEELYGKDKGRFYGYIVPALRKACQAIGRALRSPEDKAVFVLGDYRYEKYKDLLPSFVKEYSNVILADEIVNIELPWSR